MKRDNKKDRRREKGKQTEKVVQRRKKNVVSGKLSLDDLEIYLGYFFYCRTMSNDTVSE